jgi:hypothetical protein
MSMNEPGSTIRCGNCSHDLGWHSSLGRCGQCVACGGFRQPPIAEDNIEAPPSRHSYMEEAPRGAGISSVGPIRVALHTAPGIDRVAVETISRNMAEQVDWATMERLARPSQIVSVPAEENRIPLVFRSTLPLAEGEGQRLANQVRSQTTYPVVVVDHRWEVIS